MQAWSLIVLNLIVEVDDVGDWDFLIVGYGCAETMMAIQAGFF